MLSHKFRKKYVWIDVEGCYRNVEERYINKWSYLKNDEIRWFGDAILKMKKEILLRYFILKVKNERRLMDALFKMKNVDEWGMQS